MVCRLEEVVVAVLELSSISKNYGAIQALNEVSLSLEPAQVVGLMGDNGAGKSTLVKIIAGNFRPSHGEIRIEGQPVHFSQPIEARRHGVEIVYQELALCTTDAGKTFIGREVRKGFGASRSR